MGSQGSVNLGIVGADWRPNGGGVTILGCRVGGSGDNGLEIGTNAAIGVEVNGQGLHARAGYGIGIRDGVNANAIVRATAGIEDVGAVAAVQAHVSGCSAIADSASAGEVREAEAVLKLREKELKESQDALEDAEDKLKKATAEVKAKEEIVNRTQTKLEALGKEKQEAGVAKTEMSHLLMQANDEKQQKSVSLDQYKRKMLRAMKKNDSSPMAIELSRKVTTADQLLEALEQKISEQENQVQKKHEELIRLQKELADQRSELKRVQSLMNAAEHKVKECSETLNEAARQVESASRKRKSTQDEHDEKASTLNRVRQG